jgi:hypothetical protein
MTKTTEPMLPAEIAEFERTEAQWQVQSSVRDVAVNLLRIIAGGGDPFDLYPSMFRAVDALAKYDEAYPGPRSFEEITLIRITI